MLVDARESAGLSQRDLASELGVPHTWVSKVETGERRIDVIELCWFCRACGVDPSDITKRLLLQIKKGKR